MRLIRSQEQLATRAVQPERKKLLSAFEKRAALRFRRQDLLNLAFSHRSYSNEDAEPGNNERLEFLGDSVLGLVVAEYLFVNFPERSEGDLAKIKSFVVSEESLAEIAVSLGIPSCLLIGKGEEHSGGRSKKAILADALEAIIGALFLDAGLKETQRFILSFMVPQIDMVIADKHRKDYKTLLQERVQKSLKTYPRYVLVKKTGPDHAKVFWIEALIGEDRFGPADGHNKKEAEQKVAKLAYLALFGEENTNAG